MSLILDALRKSEHGRHGASDSVLPLIVTPRAGRARKKRLAYLPILIMLLAVTAAVVIFFYRETIFPPHVVTRLPATAVPAPAPTQLKPQRQQQVQQQRLAEVPIKAVEQVTLPEIEPARSIAPVKSEKPPAVKPEIAMPDSTIADRQEVVKRSLPTKPEQTGTSAPEQKIKPAPESVKRDATPAALSTFPADFIRKVQPLHLDFHVYSSDISRRMVYINNREYEEGDRLKNNLKIVRIVPQGAVMQLNQQSFLLAAQD